MGRMRKKSLSGRTMGTLAGGVLILILFVLAAIFFAPDKPTAPARSVVSYETRPEQRAEPASWSEVEAQQVVTAAEESGEEGTEAASPDEATAEQLRPVAVIGRVTARDGGKAIFKADVYVRRIWTQEEEEEWQEKSDAMFRSGDMEAHDAFIDERRLLRSADHTETTPAGGYRLTVAMPGDYVLRVRARGYRDEIIEFEIDENETEVERDVQLSDGASISGRITEAGTGRVVVGLRVYVGERHDSGNQDLFENLLREFDNNYGWGYEAETDAQGYYQIKGLSVANYAVSPDYRDAPYKAGGVLPYQPVTIRAEDEQVTGVNFQLEPAGLVWGYVLTPDGEPVRSDLVLATSESIVSQFIGAAMDAVLKQEIPVTGSSESDGYYELWGVPLNKEWRVYADSKNEAPVLSDSVFLTTSQREARIDIYMFPGTTVYGRVVDTKGEGIGQADVVCFPGYMKLVGPMYSAQAFRETRSDDDGYFEVPDLPEGHYQVYANKQGYKFATKGQEIYPDGFSDIERLKVVLRPVDEGEHTIYGTVRDTRGKLLADAHVNVGGLGTQSMSGVEHSANTNGKGEYQIDGVEAGMYAMEVQREGYSTKIVRRVRINEATHVVMEARGLIRGEVIAKDTGDVPVSGARIVSYSADRSGGMSLDLFALMDENSSTYTRQADGLYELAVVGGTFRIEASADGYTPSRIEVTIRPGDIVDGVDFKLSRAGGSIEGEVVTSDGESPQGAIVMLVEGETSGLAAVIMSLDDGFGQQSQRMERVGPDGTFFFDQLPEGSYTVMVQHPKYTRGSSGVVTLADGESVGGITVRLGAGGAVEGYVYERGRVVKGITVAVLSLSLGLPQTVTTDDNGYYYADGLPTGQVQLTLVPTSIATATTIRTATVEIEEGFATRYDFGDESGSTVYGQVTPGPQLAGIAVLRPPGSPVPRRGGIAEITQFAGNISPLDRGGTFEFRDVQPGEWQVDIIYLQLPDPVYLHTELIVVTGEEDTVDVGVWQIDLF